MNTTDYTLKGEFFNKEDFRKRIYERYICNFNAETGDKLKAFYDSTELGLFKEALNLVEANALEYSKKNFSEYYAYLFSNFDNKKILKEISKLENKKVLIPDFYFN